MENKILQETKPQEDSIMANATKQATITLERTEEEADFLISLTQNSFEGLEEDVTFKVLREAIFNSLAGLSDTYHGASS